MKQVMTATEPGSPGVANEDWLAATSDFVVVMDGATARTDTGCRHGVAWYAAKLGSAISTRAIDPHTDLEDVLRDSIRDVAEQHAECDLSHPGTPSAAVAILRLARDALQYLVLGDVSVVLETVSTLKVVTDDRVNSTARNERDAADLFPIGSDEKQGALLRMKRAELAVRNQPGGYWVAANDPEVAKHALRGELPTGEVRRIAVLTDGAARAVTFGLLTWPAVLDLLEKNGPCALIRRVRSAEESDPVGKRWARNKRSDDATTVFARV